MSGRLIKNSYGKEEVRLTRVTRSGEHHTVRQISVSVELEGEFEATYLTGDNRQVVATDSMKNIVYVLARDHAIESIEAFALDVARHFTTLYAYVTSASARISEQPWERMVVGGEPHRFAFTGVQGERNTCEAVVQRSGGTEVRSGIEGLLVLKTTDSAFTDFVRDEFTTLADAEDRIFSTVIQACWTCASGGADWSGCRARVRRALIETFAGHKSLSVQQTLFSMGEAALEECPEIEEISLVLPNKHHLLVDLRPFGKDNPNVVFTPVDEPYGCIQGTVRR